VTETGSSLAARLRGALSWRRLTALAAVLVLSVVVVLAVLWRTGVVELPVAIRDLVGIPPTAVKLVLVMPPGQEDDQFRQGMNLALDEVNAAGGIDGLPVVLKVMFEDAYAEGVRLEVVVEDTLALADRISAESDLLAVVGHWASATALPASSIYNRNRVLYLASHATASSLTNHGFDYVFAMQPNNADNAAMMAHYAIAQGLRRFVVLSDDTDYGTETTQLFGSWATKGGGEILFRGSLTGYGRSMDRLLLFLMDNKVFSRDEIDAFFVASASAMDTAKFIQRARELGLTMPILGPEYIFSSRIESFVGLEKMKDVAGVSLYDEQSEAPEAQAFVAAFEKAYGKRPDQWAAVGYDAVKLLAYAVQKSGSREASKLADRLRIMRHEQPFVGATGLLVFTAKGLVTDTVDFVVRHNGKRFHTVASYRKPLKWDLVGPSHR
jgi:branched-chain amino acid transport system substrate-binding protein